MIETTAIAAAGIVASGLFLKYATAPVLIAYQVGRRIGRIQARRRA